MKAKRHIFFAVLEPKSPKLVQNPSESSEIVGSRRIPSGMDPKHSQPLAASEKQGWLEFWQGPPAKPQAPTKNWPPEKRHAISATICDFPRTYKKPEQLGWGAGLGCLAGLGGLSRPKLLHKHCLKHSQATLSFQKP